MQDSDPICPNDLHKKVRDSKAVCRKEKKKKEKTLQLAEAAI